MRNLFIFAKHTKARESICIWRNYLHMHLPCPVPTIGMYDHHVQLSDHSICCECLRKCSAGHASTAHKRHFLGPASAGLQPFVAAPRMVPAHVQSDSMMKDTKGTKYHITWKSALLWPNLLGLFCQNPLQVTVFCCLKQTTRWYTVSDTLIVDLRRNIIRVGSTRSALYLFQTPPTPQITTATTAAGSPRRKACPRHEEDMTILSVGLPLLDLLQARTCKRKAWSIRSWLLLELFWILLNYIELIEFYNVNELTLTPSRWFLLHHRYKGSIYI